jgi:hypothetical protein
MAMDRFGGSVDGHGIVVGVTETGWSRQRREPVDIHNILNSHKVQNRLHTTMHLSGWLSERQALASPSH